MHTRGAITPNQAFAGIRLPKSREAPQIELMLIFYLDRLALVRELATPRLAARESDAAGCLPRDDTAASV